MKLLKFSASWCGPCKMLTNTIESVKNDIPYEIEEIDIDENTEMTTKFQVRGVPTLVLMNGDSEVKRTSGAMSASQLKEFLA